MKKPVAVVLGRPVVPWSLGPLVPWSFGPPRAAVRCPVVGGPVVSGPAVRGSLATCYRSSTLCYPIHSRDTHLFRIMKQTNMTNIGAQKHRNTNGRKMSLNGEVPGKRDPRLQEQGRSEHRNPRQSR